MNNAPGSYSFQCVVDLPWTMQAEVGGLLLTLLLAKKSFDVEPYLANSALLAVQDSAVLWPLAMGVFLAVVIYHAMHMVRMWQEEEHINRVTYSALAVVLIIAAVWIVRTAYCRVWSFWFCGEDSGYSLANCWHVILALILALGALAWYRVYGCGRERQPIPRRPHENLTERSTKQSGTEWKNLH